MRIFRSFQVLAIALVVGLMATPLIASQIESVAVFDPSANELPEGLAVDSHGNFYVGMALTGEIKKVTPAGQVSTVTNLPSPGNGFMVGMAFDRRGDLYVALASFDPATHGIYRINRGSSHAELFAPLPDNRLPNALAFDQRGNLLVSDSFLGRVWTIDGAGNVDTWIDDPLLLGIAGPPLGIPVGANGVAFGVGGRHLYVANTDLGRIVRIEVKSDGSAGKTEVFVEDLDLLKGADGIAFDNKNNLYVGVNRQDRIVMLSPAGVPSIVMEGGPLQFPASLAFGKGSESKNLYLSNFALFRAIGATPGGPEPALLKMGVGVPGRPLP